ncbi:amino acid permease [Bacteroidetes bacterium endosymbiont of Geopemphigus sp.]|uniref:amino acid permease n=1 Tax=Bacteroidetes bacterium endosymbiont of Geopemphigus sp. TaxID=2047937 RepID=UPI000CD1763F|nr:amino acid permease [Bacteroidetes bacterium endosymbiont of Geopemphigus sp.]
MKNLFRKKTIDHINQDISDRDKDSGGLHKTLGVKDLTFMGIGALIGAGIFSTIGQAVYSGGPGVIFLFIISATTCGLTALCYAEFASRFPVSGSAYTYSYIAFGELAAWIIGWALILEYAIGNIVVSISWSGYFDNLLQGLGIVLPRWMVIDYHTAFQLHKSALEVGKPTAELAWSMAPEIFNTKIFFNFPAFFVVIFVGWLTYIGIRESKRMNNAMVYVKLAVLLLIIGVGFFHIDNHNYVPFFPNGFSGALKGISAVFFAYIGFDAISTTAEECKNPQRDMPRSMGYALLITTLIYVAVTIVVTGMVDYKEFKGVTDPLAFIFNRIDLNFISRVVAFSAIVASLSVLLVFQIAQPRIWLTMSRDGLLPKQFSNIHPKYKTPSFATVLSGALVAIPALFVEPSLMVHLISIGTLFAFLLVCAGIMFMPRDPNGKGFRIPYINGRWIMPIIFALFAYFFRDSFIKALSFDIHKLQDALYLIFILFFVWFTFLTFTRSYSLIPVMGAIACLYLMIEIPSSGWIAFFIWMILGLVVYFAFGRFNSNLRKKASQVL